MTKLIEQVAAKYNGNIVLEGTVKFSVGGDDFCLTDGTLYATLEDGSFLPGFQKVRSMRAVEKFIALRAE